MINFFKKETRKPGLRITISLTLVMIGLFCGAFLIGGDFATSLGLTGWAYIVLAGLLLTYGAAIFIRHKSNWKPTLLIIGTLTFSITGLGLAGIIAEPGLHNLQGDNFKKEGRYETALLEYRKGGKANFTTRLPETYLLLGHRNFEEEKYSEALVNYKKVLEGEFYPNSYVNTTRQQIGRTYLAQASNFEKSKGWASAIETYKLALFQWDSQLESKTDEETKKRIGTLYLAWALDLEREGRPELEALAKFDEVLKDGNNLEAIEEAKNWARAILFRLGDEELTAGRFERAIAAYRRTLDRYDGNIAMLTPYFSKTYLAWGRKLNEENEFEKALDLLEPALKNWANEKEKPVYLSSIVESYVGLGRKDITNKNYAVVVERLTPAFNLYWNADSNHYLQETIIEALIAQAIGFEDTKNYNPAIERYERAKTYLLNNPRTEEKLDVALMQIYIRQGNEFEQSRSFARALTSYQDGLIYAGATANPYIQKDLYERLERLRNIINYQTEIKTYFAQGSEAEANQNYLKAIECYEQALIYAITISEDATKTDLQGRLLRLHTTQGETFLGTQKYSLAAENFEKGLIYAEKLNDDTAKSKLNDKLIGVYQAELEEQEQIDEQIEHDKQSTENEVTETLAQLGIVSCSFVPVVGIGCDVASVGISIKDGDWLGVAFSIVGFVPIIGDAIGDGGKAAKIGARLVELEPKLVKLGKLVEQAQVVRIAKRERLTSTIGKRQFSNWDGRVNYSHLADSVEVKAGKDFTLAQKNLILEQNRIKNGGLVRSDISGKPLTTPARNEKGVTPDPDEWQFDHIIPKSKGGTNSYSNVQVISRAENRAKSDN